MLNIFAALAILNTGNPIVAFVIVGVLVAAALYFVPRWIPMDASAWKVIRIVVIVALVLWALSIFHVI